MRLKHPLLGVLIGLSLLLAPACVSTIFLSGSFSVWPGGIISFPVGGEGITVTLTNEGPGTLVITRERGFLRDHEIYQLEPGETRYHVTSKKRYFQARNDSEEPATLLVDSTST